MRCCAARTCARASSSRRSSPGARRSRGSRRTCASSSISGARRSATPASSPNSVQQRIDAIYRAESRRVLATLGRLLGDFDLAEEALHDAFRAALEQWPKEGLPANPRAWLVSAGRFKAIDSIRRNARFDALSDEHEEVASPETNTIEPDEVADDQLRLVFTCCHPAFAPDAQVVLTLREVCGLTTEEIADFAQR